MELASTGRLRLRWLDDGDARFMLELVNDPSWIRYIGQRDVKTLDDARRYIADGPVAMYARVGFGLYAVELKHSGEAIGLCGPIKRETFDEVDIGFAFLPRYRGQGYALEAASAVMAYARDVLALRRIVAMLSKDNDRSRRLLDRLGFRFERTVKLHADDDEPLDLYAAAMDRPI